MNIKYYFLIDIIITYDSMEDYMNSNNKFIPIYSDINSLIFSQYNITQGVMADLYKCCNK